MKKILALILITLISFSVFASIADLINTDISSQTGITCEYNPVGKNLASPDALKNPDSYRIGVNYSIGTDWLFLENRILLDKFQASLIHFTDKISANFALPFKWIKPFFGFGLNLTLGQNYDNGPFYFGLDDVMITRIPHIIFEGYSDNIIPSRFYNCGLKFNISSKLNVITGYSILMKDFSYNLSNLEDLPLVLDLGQISLSITYGM